MLRFVLCAVLALNAVAASASAIRMHLEPLAAEEPAPCHAGTTTPDSTHVGDHACCKDGGTGCACAQAVAPFAVLQLPSAGSPREGTARVPPAGHLAPALPDPIRPPIA
jgi:hypothetical protein